MAQISAKPESLKIQVNNLASVASKIQRIENDLYNLSAQMRNNNSSEVYRKVASKISGQAAALKTQKTSVSKMKSGLDQIQRIYKNTENSVEGTFHKESNVDWSQTNSWGIRTDVITKKWNSNWNSFFNDLKEDGKFSDSWHEKALGISGAVLGEEFSAKIGHKVGNVEVDGKLKGEWDVSKGEAELSAKGTAKASAWEGEAEVEYGLYSSSTKVSALTGAVSGEAVIGLYRNGKFDPSFGVGAKASANVLQVEREQKLGTDDYNVHVGTEGKALGAEAEAGVKISKEGLKASAGAEAYLAKGEVKGGFEVFGIKVDLSVEGKVGAVGAKIGAEVEETSASGEIGASLLGGAGLKVKVDWTDLAKKVSKWKW